MTFSTSSLADKNGRKRQSCMINTLIRIIVREKHKIILLCIIVRARSRHWKELRTTKSARERERERAHREMKLINKKEFWRSQTHFSSFLDSSPTTIVTQSTIQIPSIFSTWFTKICLQETKIIFNSFSLFFFFHVLLAISKNPHVWRFFLPCLLLQVIRPEGIIIVIFTLCLCTVPQRSPSNKKITFNENPKQQQPRLRENREHTSSVKLCRRPFLNPFFVNTLTFLVVQARM